MAQQKNHDYHILPPSIWPFVGSVSGFIMLFGAVLWMTGQGPYMFLVGLAGVITTMVGWWTEVVRESHAGDHTPVVRIGLRYGFIFFIMSEVMFFAAWFWSFFKHALYPMDPGGMSPAVDGIWPPAGIETFDPWHLPLINTLILLCSGAAATWAHHALVHENNKKDMKTGLLLAIVLGVIFTGFQAYEYTHAAFGFAGNIYGANFFMATGFHGAHVIIGTVFLFVCYLRVRRDHFTAEKHIGFEAAAWYWHFVDVVWLFLFAAIYVWGS
ncbi:cytochrome c oxidase subunit III [Dinoroseobacter shibae DFL 12 = DSM 16493]|jgi:cytochrome c oxidase subunit 3|uniref:Cytochrome c oxidase subunit 3 n=1 Tax=Dinoroseobacter shibae (strain DSM 16493 / NCIMB 14021 / DFL 12) TaxID=398580 RepID=A8LHT9_DINSH|nr:MULTISPECIES: cytochrome c oxidase subunit 3 [Dinoroseobacter]ABV92886.1 cytochrome c oxidase subunit III [Dinoroseobacter shibae DFL 12 = DSM 16493]MDD9715986.1 cytochrome c oxidase subunit 3 [Dinoroseobacter sp. PD6]URF47822.1 cytochrome c oxidase subunit 3 [Dinoroseobacter shibae]URF52132.1 cytochrome c oxidase subunit 3 [Dinoroseobacter shibae]